MTRYYIPVSIENKIIVDEPGIDGVPIDAINVRNEIKIISKVFILYPTLDAINTVAITCIIAVPFILIVIPNGSVKEIISLFIPSSSSQVFSFNDKAAADDEAEIPKRATLLIFLIKIKGCN